METLHVLQRVVRCRVHLPRVKSANFGSTSCTPNIFTKFLWRSWAGPQTCSTVVPNSITIYTVQYPGEQCRRGKLRALLLPKQLLPVHARSLLSRVPNVFKWPPITCGVTIHGCNVLSGAMCTCHVSKVQILAALYAYQIFLHSPMLMHTLAKKSYPVCCIMALITL